MNIPVYRFPSSIGLMDLGDIHRGDFACDKKLLKKAIDFIANNSRMYWFSTGDLLNVGLANSTTGAYTTACLEMERDDLYKDIERIADKCLGVTKSNHHSRVDRLIGLSLDRMICRENKLPFLGAIGVFSIVCDKAAYYVACHHGVGSGVTRGAKTNSLERLATIVPGADLYFEGHTHSFLYFKNDYLLIDRKRLLVNKHGATFVVTGHFLDYEDSYPADKKLPPMPKGAAFVEFQAAGAGNTCNKKITVDFFDG